MGSVNELMTELADAVRLKSGATGEMTIKQMVTAMAGITVSGDLGFTSGTIRPAATGSVVRVTHKLGHTPGALIFIKSGSSEGSVPSGLTTLTDSLVSIIFGEDSGHCYSYNSVRKNTSSSGTNSYSITKYWTSSTSTPAAVFGTDQATNAYYCTNINATTFTSPKSLISGDSYLWIAFRAPLK